MIIPTKYKMLVDSKLEPKAKQGTIVYSLTEGWDYGCSNEDTRRTGVEHEAVTLRADGGYPFFTVPETDIQAIKD